MALQHTEGAAQVAHMREVKEGIDHPGLADGQMGIDQVTAQLRQCQHQQSRQAEYERFAALRHGSHLETKAAFYRKPRGDWLR